MKKCNWGTRSQLLEYKIRNNVNRLFNTNLIVCKNMFLVIRFHLLTASLPKLCNNQIKILKKTLNSFRFQLKMNTMCVCLPQKICCLIASDFKKFYAKQYRICFFKFWFFIPSNAIVWINNLWVYILDIYVYTC